MINHKMSYDQSRWFMSDQSILWLIILLSFDVPPIIYLLLYIQEQKSQGYDRSYNSYERSEAKIFFIWAIIKCPMIDQGGLWVIRAFCEWSFFCLLMYLYNLSFTLYTRAESQGYSCIWPIIQLQWAIRSQNFHHLSNHKTSYDWSRWFMSDQHNLWANSAQGFFVQFLSSCLEISCLHIPSDNNYRIFFFFSMSIHKMCLSDQTCIN